MEQMMNRIPFTCLPLHNHIQYTPLISACHLKHKQEHQRFQPIWLQLFACSVHLLYLLFHVYEYMDQENRQKPQSPKSNYIRCIKSKKYLKKRICAHIQPFSNCFIILSFLFPLFFKCSSYFIILVKKSQLSTQQELTSFIKILHKLVKHQEAGASNLLPYIPAVNSSPFTEDSSLHP